MRLLTFQRQELVEEALLNGISYLNWNSALNRIKEIHEEFIVESETGETTRPLYCYAYCYNYGTPSIDFISRQWSSLMGYMHLSLFADCFIELDVPEGEILAFSGHSVYDSLMSLKETISHCESTPKFKDDIEALIPYVRKEWIVSYTPYLNKGYSPQRLTPIILQQDKFPMYVAAVGVSGQGYYLDPIKLNEEEGYIQDDTFKPLVCNDKENYSVAVWHLLSPTGGENLKQSLFGKQKLTKEFRNLIYKYNIKFLTDLRNLLKRDITAEDLTDIELQSNNRMQPTTSQTNEFTS